ncbi:MAG: hypothetical protein K9J30_08770 [Bacteroidales bacterium]|nr:hypothetical protein [Bacteroidales bacterium]
MKNKYFTIIVFAIVLFSNQGKSQSLTLISTDTSNSWEYSFDGFEAGDMRYHQKYLKDTIIDSLEYAVFKIDSYSYYNPAGLFIGEYSYYSREILVREENGNLYVVGYYNGIESLVFSSNWEIGDTIIFREDDSEDDIVLISIDTVKYGSRERRVWNFTKVVGFTVASFIEGIGSTLDIIETPLSYSDYYYGFLECCIIEGETIYNDCLFPLNTEFKQRLNVGFEIYPNPVSAGIFFISTQQDDLNNLRYEIFDISG